MDRKSGSNPRKRVSVRYFNLGFLRQRQVRRILSLAGYDLKLGMPAQGDAVAVWGNSPTSYRGHQVAQRYNAPIIRIEDAFLRSLHPARMHREAPIGLIIDPMGNHFDPSQPSALEHMLLHDPLDHSNDLERAKNIMARIKAAKLSKYAGYNPAAPQPAAGYVLVIDQTRGDASVLASNGCDTLFSEMLYYAQEQHPGQRIVIKTHPETTSGKRQGYFGPEHVTRSNITLYSGGASIWDLLENAVAVYTLSSTVGFEAIMAGHKPHVFGQPFYAGWGLTFDAFPVQRRNRTLTKAQLVAAALIKYPTWYDPFRDELCDIETVLDVLESRQRAYLQDQNGWYAHGMRLWKRKPLRQFFGQYGPVNFPRNTRNRGDIRPHMVWANKSRTAPNTATRIEDGFIRSRGLGAHLVPPLSLVSDRSGIYYDPTHPSDLETLLANGPEIRGDQRHRAQRLIENLIEHDVSKYNLPGSDPDLPTDRDGRYRILVPGQVEDDASIKLGCIDIKTNLDLLRQTRAAHPDAIIIYKPHPDVVAGLRLGHIPKDDLAKLTDYVLPDAPIATLLRQVDAVHTLTSLTGFEALLRGCAVTTYGQPFYAGWGLTNDHAPPHPRRGRLLDLETLVHRTLIDYPRYFDPVSKSACPVEVILWRIQQGDIPSGGPSNRILSKLQGLFASSAPFWR